jgi:hypothetical protein
MVLAALTLGRLADSGPGQQDRKPFPTYGRRFHWKAQRGSDKIHVIHVIHVTVNWATPMRVGIR